MDGYSCCHGNRKEYKVLLFHIYISVTLVNVVGTTVQHRTISKTINEYHVLSTSIV